MAQRSTALTRREILMAGAAGAFALTPGSALARARRIAPAVAGGRRVAVLGGGMAGLTVAHELIERGFEVDVYERKALGGKARSIPVPGTGTDGRRDLPGEHGFRFFPGFYHHIPDSMRRTPFPGNANGVYDNFRSANELRNYRNGGRADGTLFGVAPHPEELRTPAGWQRVLAEVIEQKGIPPHEAEFFANRVVVFLTSSDERRFGQWEHVSWWDYVRAEGKSEEYQKVVAQGLTRTLVAAKETLASTRTIGNMAEAFVMNIMQRGNDGAVDRVLNAPTNEAWIDPWVAHLEGLGVRFHVGQAIEALEVGGGRITGARAVDAGGTRRTVEADWFVSAMPVERARELLSKEVLALDPSLEGMHELFTDWMNGIQYFLRRPASIGNGHVTFADAPWALTALTQQQFWVPKFTRDYGDGTVVDCLSVDVSDWDTPGIVFGKPAKECTREEVHQEVWAQMKDHIEDTGASILPDDILHSWFLDPAIQWDPKAGRNTNDEPLLVNTVGSWERRPEASTAIPNLFLAGDYVQTDIDLATMEGANESGREAVNRLLAAAGSTAAPAAKYQLYDPPEFEAIKRADAELFKAGLPNPFDRPEAWPGRAARTAAGRR
jgi:uncharacterized protein with NAD-binding domain and iron-sulfur cluster